MPSAVCMISLETEASSASMASYPGLFRSRTVILWTRGSSCAARMALLTTSLRNAAD